MTPEQFAGWCGPSALAAVLTTPERCRLRSGCARDLLAAGAEPPSTSTASMVTALERHGFVVEPHDPITGEPCVLVDTGAAPTSLMAWREVLETAPLPAVEQCLAALYADHRPLADWLSRGGTWLYVVVLDRTAHWIAVREGRMLTDGDYADRRVSAALRVRRA